MASTLNPYLMFRGRAREALEFYAAVFGGSPEIMTHGQYAPDSPYADQVMHGYLGTDQGFALMASDVPAEVPAAEGGRVALSGDDAELRDWFAALADGGTVSVALEKQMWGDEFGELTDRFGVSWLVNISGG